MTYNRVFWLGALLLVCLLARIKTAHAQGWTSASHWQSGNPSEPYASDGNYVSGLSNFLGDEVSAAINYPGPGATYRIEGFGLNKGFQYGRDVVPFGKFHHLARAIAHPAPDTFVVLEEKLPFVAGNRSIHLIFYKIDIQGSSNDIFLETEITASIPGTNAYAHTLLTSANGDYLVLGSVENTAAPGNRDVLLARLSAQGALLWTAIFPTPDDDVPFQVVPGANGTWHILKSVAPFGQIRLLNVDANGNLLGDINLPGNTADMPVDLAATADGNLVLTGLNLSEDLFLQKMGTDGTVIWRHDFTIPEEMSAHSLLEDANGDIVVLCNRTTLTTNEKDGFLMKFDPAGTPVWERRIGRDNRPETLTKLALCPDGGYLLGGRYFTQNINHAYVVKTDANGIIKPGRIFGNVFRDNDVDCSNTAGDLPLANRTVQAYRDSANVYYASTNLLGDYEIECDTGNYTVSLIQPNAYWQACANDVPVHISYLDKAVVDFSQQAAIDCPYLTVEHGLINARPCDTTTMYLDYCNYGPVTAENAYVDVTLDPLLTYVSSTIPPSATNGNVLTFPLGNIASEDCGHLEIEVAVDCDAQAGQAVCTEAHIFPDTICDPANPAWSGAYVEVKAECQGDSILFQIKNTGSGPMSEYLEYIVIEDAVLLRSGAFKLAPGETMDVKALADGSTWRLSAGQESGAPGFGRPTVAVEGCVNGGGPASTGFVNSFSENDADPFVSSQCILVTNSFDPNDKQALPTGFGNENNIFANTDLEYMIRFQNTGTDTAFRVILLDTLSPHLDPATFHAGTSSHPYRYELTENGVVRFTFQPIALPHSSVNEPGSNGFVTFRIAQKRDNPVGTRIENRAGIYFDFNLPVITNTVFHTVHAPWLKLVSVDQPGVAPMLHFQAFPNPFAEQVTVRLEGAEMPDAVLRLFSTDGRLVQAMPFRQNQLTLDRKDLPAGMYFFSVEVRGKALGSGRLVAE
ncbi:MAG: T9SS type A sorting domain-containing protein [Saprospiraceae bacterium]